MSSHEAFPVSSKWSGVAGKYVNHVGAHCSKCGRWEWAPARTSGLGNRIFHNKGWKLGSRRSQDVCPGCRVIKHHKVLGVVETTVPEPVNTAMQEALEPVLEQMAEAIVAEEIEEAKAVAAVLDPPKPAKPARKPRGPNKNTKRDGFVHRESAYNAARRWVERTYPEVRWAKHTIHYETFLGKDGRTWSWRELDGWKSEAKTEEAMPDEVRQPTKEDRRAIMDALEKGYDEVAERWLKDGSDKATAERLNVPRKWVTEIREQFFGAHDRNEAADEERKKRDEAIAMAQAAVERLTQMALEAEQLLVKLKTAG